MAGGGVAQVGDDVALDDLGARLAGIPFFALAITTLSGVLGPLRPADPRYWLGCAWFILLSALLWHANLFALQRLRQRQDWPAHPLRKVARLLAANVATTVPLSVVMHVLWYRFARLPLDRRQVAVTTLVIVLAVALVTHVYETAYLVRQRERDALTAERLDRARVEAELLALKTQVDPHFLYNALHCLTALIPKDAVQAARFAERLGEVYLYILSHRGENLVPVEDELRFAFGYAELLRLRFGEAVHLRREGEADVAGLLIPPVSLQVLLENAVKHNAVREEDPLEIRLRLFSDRIEVQNRKSKAVETRSSGLGLANLDGRYRRIVGQGLEVRDEETEFSVTLPLVRPAAT